MAYEVDFSKAKLPKFETEDQEREFWAIRDSTEYMDWSKARPAVFPDLKPTTRTISVRLPESLITELKILANAKDVPYQSLMKIFLTEKVRQELHNVHV